jgi:hypothetical protein
VPRSLSENLEVLRHTSVKVEIEFTKGTTSLLVINATYQSRANFLDFITEEMDEKNYISNSTLVRQKFNNLKAPAKSRLQTIPYTVVLAD